MMSHQEEEEEDPVVEEYPVYLNNSYPDRLCLAQYPLRSKDNPYYEKASQARLKPQSETLEMDVPIRTHGPNFDSGKAAHLALVSNDGDQPCFLSGVMDKLVLSGSSTADTGRYAVGIVKNGELHLVPLDGMLQMKPTFGHVDKADAEETPATEKLEDEKISVKFKREGTSKQMRDGRQKELLKEREEEPWVDLQVVQGGQSDVDRLLCQDKSAQSWKEKMSPEQYLARLLSLRPVIRCRGQIDYSKQTIQEIQTLPLEAQVTAVMLKVQASRSEELLRILGVESETENLLEIVQTCAVMVQGNWVVQSHLLYPDGWKSGFCGVPAENMRKGRDYILDRFIDGQTVHRKEVVAATHIPDREVLEILRPIGKLEEDQLGTGKGWKFALPTDHGFIHRHPHVLGLQQLLWTVRKTSINETGAEGDAAETK